MGLAGPKRTRTQREADLAETARLDRMGLTQRQIAERIGVSSVQICFDLRKIRKRYVEMANVHAGERIGELLTGYRDVRREAWLAWERSKQDANRVSTRVGGRDGGSVTTTTEGRAPGNECLQTILETYAAERRLLGLDQEQATLFLTPASVVAMMNAVMAAIGRRVSDPEVLRLVKLDVLEMLPRSVRPADATAAAAPTCDRELVDADQGADEPADQQASIATEPPDAGVAAEPALNGTHAGGGDGDLFEEI